MSPLFIPNAKLGDHNVCFYVSPQEKQSLLFSNLKVGLDNGCSAVYVASEEDAEQVRFEMKKFGLEVDDPKKLRIMTSTNFIPQMENFASIEFWNKPEASLTKV